MDGSLDIRPCTTGDVDALEAAMPSGGRSRFHARRLLEQLTQRSTYLIAWLDHVPVGHLNLRARSGEPAVRARLGSVPEVDALAVAPARQGLGIGSALLQVAHQSARDHGHEHVGLAVNVDNLVARRLYAGHGYADWGHGELDLCWTYTDAAGVDHIECERCAYLIKPLTADRIDANAANRPSSPRAAQTGTMPDPYA